MLNFRTFFVGLFASNANTVDLEAAKEAGRRDARETVGAYAEAFRDEVSHILHDTQSRVLYVDGEIAKPSEPVDYSGWSRPQLMTEAREQGFETERTMTREDLIRILTK